MRRHGLLAAFLPCALLFVAAARGEEGIASVDEAWMKAMKAGDVNAVVACYAPDAVVWLPDSPQATGTKAIRELYAGWFAAYTVMDAKVDGTHRRAGDMSAGWGQFTLKLKPKAGGEPVVQKGRFTAVAAKIGGKWVYVADHASNEPAPAPASNH